MLREKDLDLAVDLGIINENTKNEIESGSNCCEESDDYCSNLKTTIDELQKTIVSLSNKLRKKDEEIERLRYDLRNERRSCNLLNQYLDEAKSDNRILEKIIDNLKKGNKQ